MPTIGKPDTGTNPFSKIKMNRAPVEGKELGDKLNQVIGRDEMNKGIKFVDRRNHNQIGKDEFLQLLTFQLANQDPMKPMDQHKFSSDLAQFSSLEQLVNMNSKFKKLNPNPEVQDKFYGASFLGKEVTTTGTTVRLDENSPSIDVPFFVKENAERVVVRLLDSKDQMAFQTELKNVKKGSNIFKWDGNGMDKLRAPSGNYSAKVFAWDSNSGTVDTEVRSKGVVNGVTFENGETVLWLKSGKKLFLRDVKSFNLESGSQKNVDNRPNLKGPEKPINKDLVSNYKKQMN